MNTNRANQVVRDVVISILFCFGIACIVNVIKGGTFSLQLIISFGYGGIGYALLFFIQAKRLYWTTLIGFLVVVGGTLVFGTLNAWLWSGGFATHIDYKNFFSTVGFAVLFSSIIYYFFYNREKALLIENELKQIKLTQAEQERALVVSQLQVLQSQIEPHFLFNTLANLQVLIDTDPRKAKKLLERLTELLRISLKKSRRQWIMLADEIDLLDAYLGIQSMRLGDRLNYRFVINDDVDMQWDIPPHMIQPLVENAIYHGIEPSEDGGEIEVCLCCENNKLIVEVKDNGVGFNYPSMHLGHGVSLDNIRQRLKGLYGEQARLFISAHESGGVTAKMELLPGGH
ncbi:sensor histidine kinase [Photobacterium lipolyticum]|uniref:Sensor histidine kinase n=1 Tax=Photobacterium lipolyticum TaxID=266810 RepID=A0A2T3MZA8_9GAMM|nr:histidine kinase [Photobacterium lipolyticum]PSW05240.1 sensor histidine kinase [Photobacterium lipolyticum]